MVTICARGQNIMYSNHNPAKRRNSGHALLYICFCYMTRATLTNHRWILWLNDLCRLGPVKYMHENLAYLYSSLFGSFILLPSFRSFFAVKINLPYVRLLVLKLITNRWAWALVPMKLVEPGTALAWGGGIHGNPASGPQQAPSHWNTSVEYLPTPYSPTHPHEGGRDGKNQAQNGSKTAS